MRWSTPKEGEVRWNWRFAWWPTQIPSLGTKIWLEWYYAEEEWFAKTGWSSKERLDGIRRVNLIRLKECAHPNTAQEEEKGKLSLVKDK